MILGQKLCLSRRRSNSPNYLPVSQANYGLLLKELKEVFEPKGYLITAALPAGESNINHSYDVPTLQK